MKSLVLGLSLLLVPPAVFAGEVLRELSGSELRVVNDQGQPRLVTVLRIEAPGISKGRYAITGQVRHERVDGTAYLEMWSHFPDGSRYFSRTLATVGPLRGLTGSSDWRRFVIPFFNQEGGAPPARLELGVMLPGRGTVHLGALRLVQYDPGEDPLAGDGQWWGDRFAGWLGGIGGLAVGVLGAVIGWLTSAGRARGLALGLLKALMLTGGMMLIVGVAALFLGQPYAVYYPLLLIGGISTVVAAGVFPTARRRYEEIELRKITAMDMPSPR
jgi:hypothetical protein